MRRTHTRGRTDRQTERQGTLQKAEANCIWTPLLSRLVSKGPSSTIFRSLTPRPNTALKDSHADTALLLSVFSHVFTAYRQIYIHVKHASLYGYAGLVCFGLRACIPAWMHACVRVWVSLCILNTKSSTWNIKRWRWRCPSAGIGWGRVMILSRSMSCGNGCLAHPLITSMFTPTSITLVFLLSKWPSCLRRFLLLIARGGGGCTRDCTVKTTQL